MCIYSSFELIRIIVRDLKKLELPPTVSEGSLRATARKLWHNRSRLHWMRSVVSYRAGAGTPARSDAISEPHAGTSHKIFSVEPPQCAEWQEQFARIFTAYNLSCEYLCHFNASQIGTFNFTCTWYLTFNARCRFYSWISTSSIWSKTNLPCLKRISQFSPLRPLNFTRETFHSDTYR